jgi:phage FluMu gp28-like protein
MARNTKVQPKYKGCAKILPNKPNALLLAYQAKWVKDSSRIKLMEKSRQIGISWGTAYAVVERTARQGARNDQWISSRDEIQAKLFIEDCMMWARMLQLAAEDMGEQVVDPEQRTTAYVLKFTNGRRINSMSSNPDAQAGKRGGRVLDEFALHKDPRKLWAITYPGITWGGSMEVISSQRGNKNYFNDLIREVKERGNPKKISLHRVTLEDALNQGFLHRLQQSLPNDDERQTMDEARYYDFIKYGMPDEESFQQEYMCIPEDDDAAFLDYQLITGCEYTGGISWEYDMEQLDKARGRLYGGLDIGRKHDLTVLWIIEVVGEMRYTRKIITLKNMPKPEQEKILWPYFTTLTRISMDYTGIGIGWGDDAKAKFGSYKVDLVSFTSTTKERMAYPVRAGFEDKNLRIPEDTAIRADLRSITKSISSSGNIRFTAERNGEGHADRFWALALALEAAEANKGSRIEFLSIPRTNELAERQKITKVGWGTVSGEQNFGGY